MSSTVVLLVLLGLKVIADSFAPWAECDRLVVHAVGCVEAPEWHRRSGLWGGGLI